MSTSARLDDPPAPVARRLRLLVAEPDLADGIPDGDLHLAQRVLEVAGLRLGPGPWEPDRPEDPAFLGWLVVEGIVAHEVVLAGDVTMQLAGPGDVVDPFGAQSADAFAVHRWRAVDDVLLAPLDHRVVAAARKWPALGVALYRRLSAQAMRASVHTALAQLGRVELRILAMLWHLAERWGVVTPDGVAVQVRLTHDALGRLVGARRPTVSLALKELGAQGRVVRRRDGLLVLDPASRDLLRSPAD